MKLALTRREIGPRGFPDLRPAASWEWALVVGRLRLGGVVEVVAGYGALRRVLLAIGVAGRQAFSRTVYVQLVALCTGLPHDGTRVQDLRLPAGWRYDGKIWSYDAERAAREVGS